MAFSDSQPFASKVRHFAEASLLRRYALVSRDIKSANSVRSDPHALAAELRQFVGQGCPKDMGLPCRPQIDFGAMQRLA
jgi:hypothetical protein